jgi:phage terminase large subunit-like protein
MESVTVGAVIADTPPETAPPRRRARRLSRAALVILFIEKYCRVPEGEHVGKPLRLDRFQRRFIVDVYNNRAGTRRAYLSMARKNGKSALIAALVLVHLVGPEMRPNSQIISGARSRDQAALVFALAEKMILLDATLASVVRVIPSQKRLVGVPGNVEFRALSAEAGTAHGLSPALAILDEVGQVHGPVDAFIDAIQTAQGAHADPLLIAISTQAPGDGDLFSIWLDDAARSSDARIVSHVYTAPTDVELDDPKGWEAANPAAGKFRSLEEIKEAAERAKRMPSFEATFRNLYLNQRIALQTLFIAPAVWRENEGAVSAALFRDGRAVTCGIDLSATTDLTAAIFATKDDGGIVQLLAFVFTPADTVEDRARADRAPYPQFIRDGAMIAVPGKVVNYEWVAQYLAKASEGMRITRCAFDRWRIEELRRHAQACSFATGADWQAFGQGFQSMSPALANFETLLLERRLRHGGQPLLRMGAAGAVVARDPAGNRKLDKAKAKSRIDALVAAVMAVHVLVDAPVKHAPRIFMLGS